MAQIVKLSKVHPFILSGQLLHGIMERSKTSEFYVPKSIQHALFAVKLINLLRNNAMLNTMTMNNSAVSLWMVILAGALRTGKANPYPEQVSIPVRTALPFS